jgi:NAD(P)-dependent dehydrogenase (short-subunit alcohol dehydrogenase family)
MHLVLADADTQSLNEAAAELTGQGFDALAVPTDVTDPVAMLALARAAMSVRGSVDVVCNNAGIVVNGLSWEVEPEQWQRIIAVNFMGVVNGLRAFVPILRRQNSGHIVNTASMAGVTSGPGMGPYAASKHAVVAVTEALYMELGSENSGVGVSLLCPGMVDTSMPSQSLEALGGAGTIGDARAMLAQAVNAVSMSAIPPAQVAEAVLEAIDSKQFWVFTHPDRLQAVARRARGMLEGENPPPGYG